MWSRLQSLARVPFWSWCFRPEASGQLPMRLAADRHCIWWSRTWGPSKSKHMPCGRVSSSCTGLTPQAASAPGCRGLLAPLSCV